MANFGCCEAAANGTGKKRAFILVYGPNDN